MNTVDIYFNDLSPETQQAVLSAANIKYPHEGNWDVDIIPLAILSFESEEQSND